MSKTSIADACIFTIEALLITTYLLGKNIVVGDLCVSGSTLLMLAFVFRIVLLGIIYMASAFIIVLLSLFHIFPDIVMTEVSSKYLMIIYNCYKKENMVFLEAIIFFTPVLLMAFAGHLWFSLCFIWSYIGYKYMHRDVAYRALAFVKSKDKYKREVDKLRKKIMELEKAVKKNKEDSK